MIEMNTDYSERQKCVAASSRSQQHPDASRTAGCGLHLLQQVTRELMESVAPVERDKWLGGQAILRPSPANSRHVGA